MNVQVKIFYDMEYWTMSKEEICLTEITRTRQDVRHRTLWYSGKSKPTLKMESISHTSHTTFQIQLACNKSIRTYCNAWDSYQAPDMVRPCYDQVQHSSDTSMAPAHCHGNSPHLTLLSPQQCLRVCVLQLVVVVLMLPIFAWQRAFFLSTCHGWRSTLPEPCNFHGHAGWEDNDFLGLNECARCLGQQKTNSINIDHWVENLGLGWRHGEHCIWFI